MVLGVMAHSHCQRRTRTQTRIPVLYRNHSSYFSGLTKFPDFSSIIFHFSSILIINNICLKFPEFSSISCDFPRLFWSVQNSLTFHWLENVFPFSKVFSTGSDSDPCMESFPNSYCTHFRDRSPFQGQISVPIPYIGIWGSESESEPVEKSA